MIKIIGLIVIIIIIILYIFLYFVNIPDKNIGNQIDRMISLHLLSKNIQIREFLFKYIAWNRDIYTKNLFRENEVIKDYNLNIISTIEIFICYLLSTLWASNRDYKILANDYLQTIVNNYIDEGKSLDKIVEIDLSKTIVIHFRCSDIPFNRFINYNIYKYEWYKKALDYAINKSNIKFEKIIIISCNNYKNYISKLFNPSNNKTHLNTDMCKLYINEYVNNMKEFNLPIETQCNNIYQDFYILRNAACLITTTGSYGHYAGLSSKNLWITSSLNFKNNNNIFLNFGCDSAFTRKNTVIIPPIIIKHKDVKDYYNIDEMKDHINICNTC